jgi:hypothetical protein
VHACAARVRTSAGTCCAAAGAAQRFGLLAADRGGALVEAVVQDAAVKRVGQVRQHPPQPRGAGDHAGQVAELASDAGELGVEGGAAPPWERSPSFQSR